MAAAEKNKEDGELNPDELAIDIAGKSAGQFIGRECVQWSVYLNCLRETEKELMDGGQSVK